MEIFKDYLQSLVANLLFEKDVKSVRFDSKLFGKTNRDIGLLLEENIFVPRKISDRLYRFKLVPSVCLLVGRRLDNRKEKEN